MVPPCVPAFHRSSAPPSPGGGPGGESSVSFCFCSAAGPRVLTFSKKEQFPLPPGSQVHGPPTSSRHNW